MIVEKRLAYHQGQTQVGASGSQAPYGPKKKKKKKLVGKIFKKKKRLGPPLVFSLGPPPKNHESLTHLASLGGKSP